ncbi:MAG TPA: diguanylate cyclase [Burkholderiales bacterium]|nr:diguanylate cyclase [Burkholderiales bacterium]
MRAALVRIVLAAWLACAAAAYAAPALQPVTLQLNWKHQFQFAGYYAAMEQGYYREAGFEVRVQEAQEGHDPIDAVLSGVADYGVGASELALRRGQGQPVVVLATILQHSPLVLIAAASSASSVHELDGKKVMLLPHETELFAYLQQEHMSPDRLVVVPHTFDANDLLAGKVSALSGYSTDEPYLLKKAGFAFNMFSPRASGIDFYGDSLFTTERLAKTHPERVAAFLAASLKGWQYAMAHESEIADLIVSRYGKRKSREHLLFEAQELRRLMQPQLVEIGYMNPGRWEHVAATYAELGMLPPRYSLDGFLFQGGRSPDWTPLYKVGAAIVAALLVACVVVIALLRLNLLLTREIADRRQIQDELRRSEQRFRTLIESAPLAMVTWDRKRRITGWNRQAQELFGWAESEVLGRDFLSFMVPESANVEVGMIVEDAIERGIESHSVNSNLTRDNRTIEVEWHNTVVPGADGRPDSVLSLAQDVTERVRAQVALQEVNLKLKHRIDEIHELQDRLREQVMRDPLTGMYNRRFLDDALPGEIARAIRERTSLCLMMVDIDHFKQVNDTYGHQAGDEVLKTLAEILRGEARRTDVACRYGGEEFVLLLPKMNLESACQRAEHWRQTFAEAKVSIDGNLVRCTLSVGIAMFPEHGNSAEDLLRNGDRALYLAKALGRNRVVVYNMASNEGRVEGAAG